MSHARLDSTPRTTLPRPDGQAVEWRVSEGLTAYDAAVAAMEARVDQIARGEAAELVWLVEHPPLYTAGTSAGVVPTPLEADRLSAPSASSLMVRAAQPRLEPRGGPTISPYGGPRGSSPPATPALTMRGLEGTDIPRQDPLPFPLHPTGRGGQVTYHGPGQRVAYVMLDLSKRRPDVRAFVAGLERWIVDTLGAFDIAGERREDRVGVWVQRPDKAPGLDGASAEDKIAAIGIRVRRWVTFHGISLNVAPDLAHYAAIAPCGIAASHLGVTSFADLGRPVAMAEADMALGRAFVPIFGPVIRL